MNKNKTQRGITLIALIITIIVMLILVGVTVSIAINGGLFGMAKEAKEQTEIGTEREVLQEQLISRVIENGENIGIPLYDKTIDNSSIWDIVVETKTQTTYGTGWYYIEKGTDIGSYGKTKYNWVVNYETGEMVSLKENEYTKMAYGENIGVKEGLIFNLDPAIIEGINIDELKNGNTEKLGKNIELKNFDWTEKSGLTEKSFNFDGENDYIKIKYDNEQEKQELLENGFTFEYYGTLDIGNTYLNEAKVNSNWYGGIFCYWNGEESKQAYVRFGLQSPNIIRWNFGGGR